LPQSNRLEVDVYPSVDPSDEPLHFENINFISYVAFNTYGIPAVIGEEKYKSEGLPLRVLYINPANVVAVEALRTA
jgi:hypothetical protein